MRASRRKAGFTACILTLVVAALLPTETATAAPAQVTVTVDRSAPDMTSRMGVGANLTKDTLNKGGDVTAIKSGQTLMRQAARFQMQATYQSGTMNPEPAPGVYDWTSLDTRVKQITATGGIPVLDLFGVPDWMNGGLPNVTDWTRAGLPPLPSHYADFAALAKKIAERYPQVKYYVVWSENSGLWNKAMANFDYVAYTNMYNPIYDALKSVNPAIKVGGPYIVLDGTGSQADTTIPTSVPIVARNLTFLKYWLKNKHGADFLAVDRKLAQRADTTPYTNDQLMDLTPWFETVTQKLRALSPLPVWYSESYFRCDPVNENFMAAGLASMLLHQLRGGAAASMRWSPERQPGTGCPYLADNLQNLFTSTLVPGGGQALPSFYVYRTFNWTFAPGTPLYKTVSSSPTVEAMSTATNTLLINKRNVAVNVVLNGKIVPLAPYEVLLA